jgi:fructokinase
MASSVSNGVPETGSGLIVSFGEMLIDFVPTESGVSLAEAPGFLKAPGGAPANVAIAVSRLGGKASFVGKLGEDDFGRMLAGILDQNGVDGRGINFDQGARTALAFVTLRADGEREFMFYRNPSADMLLRPDELNVELIRSVRSLSLSLSENYYYFLRFSGKICFLFLIIISGVDALM